MLRRATTRLLLLAGALSLFTGCTCEREEPLRDASTPPIPADAVEHARQMVGLAMNPAIAAGSPVRVNAISHLLAIGEPAAPAIEAALARFEAGADPGTAIDLATHTPAERAALEEARQRLDEALRTIRTGEPAASGPIEGELAPEAGFRD
jgi:hypothetical protein